MSSNSTLTPTVVWAQRRDQIFVNIDLQDVKNEKILLEKDKLSFLGSSNGKQYNVELDFHGEIDPSKSRYAVKPRSVEFILVRKEAGAYWPSLLKSNLKPRWLKVDWQKWKDEDELEDDAGFDMGGMDNFDMSSLGGGASGGGNMEDSDSDDEDLPDLEDKKEENKEEKSSENQKKEEEEVKKEAKSD